MNETTLAVAPLNPVIGAEIEGVDLAHLDDATFKELRTAWLDHQVLFFRDQRWSLQEHEVFGRRFGELHIHPAAPSPPGHPAILVVHADERSKTVAGYGWHSDVSCDLEPPSASILHLTRVPPSGGDTLFASMYAAYEALSDRWQRFLSDLTAIHSSEHVYRGRYGITTHLRDGDYPKAEHPVVRIHPETGRKALYVNEGFTTRVRGMSAPESRATLDFVFQHIRNPELQCRFRWRERSVALWDNRAVQHRAIWDYFPNVRHGYRVTVKGERPV